MSGESVFIVTNSKLFTGKVVKVNKGRGDEETRIKQGKSVVLWDTTSCHRFGANQARLLMGVLTCNRLCRLRQFYLRGEEVKRSIEWLIKRLIKVGATCRITRSEVACSCGFSLSLGPTPPG